MGTPGRGASTPPRVVDVVDDGGLEASGQPILQKTADGLHVLTTAQLQALPRAALGEVFRNLILSEAGATDPDLTRQQQVDQNRLQAAELRPVLEKLAAEHVEEVLGEHGLTPTIKYSKWRYEKGVLRVCATIPRSRQRIEEPESFLQGVPLTVVSDRVESLDDMWFEIQYSDLFPGVPNPTEEDLRRSSFEGGASHSDDPRLASEIGKVSARINKLFKERDLLLGLARGRVLGTVRKTLHTLNRDASCCLATVQSFPGQASIEIYVKGDSHEKQMLVRGLKDLFPGIIIEENEGLISCSIALDSVLKQQ